MVKTTAKRAQQDGDGYPTEDTLRAITHWDYRDHNGWLQYITEAWNHHYGKIWRKGGRIRLSTGGWSGNEAIVRAMRSHPVLWPLLWESSHCGGLEVLRMPKAKDQP